MTTLTPPSRRMSAACTRDTILRRKEIHHQQISKDEGKVYQNKAR